MSEPLTRETGYAYAKLWAEAMMAQDNQSHAPGLVRRAFNQQLKDLHRNIERKDDGVTEYWKGSVDGIMEVMNRVNVVSESWIGQVTQEGPSRG